MYSLLFPFNPLTPEFSEKNLQRIGRDYKNVIAGCYFNVDIAIHTFLKSTCIITVDLTQFFLVDFSNYSTARKYWCISTRRNVIRCHFVFLEFAAVG